MLKSAQYAEDLPPAYSCGDPIADSWKESYTAAHQQVVDDVAQLLRDTRAICPLPLLERVQSEPQLWERPSHMMGGLRFVGDDDYLVKTNRGIATMARNHASGIFDCGYGLELHFEMFRRLQANQPPFEIWPSAVQITLRICRGPELSAAQEIYRDWRGIVKKFLEGTRVEANACCDVIPELERVRSKQAIPRLDVLLNLPKRENFIYQLEFDWRHDSDWEVCQRSFLALAVLFTGIQKATVAPRSRKDHLLNYWGALEGYCRQAAFDVPRKRG